MIVVYHMGVNAVVMSKLYETSVGTRRSNQISFSIVKKGKEKESL